MPLHALSPGLAFQTYDLWVMLAGVCCAAACALLGCFLVLRRLSLLGDAISHAILPGIAVAFMLSGSRGIGPMLLGAGGAGLLAAFLSSGLKRWGRVPEDASLGIVFTGMFALGVILITFAARDVDLDPGCVLYGSIETIAIGRVQFAGFEAPRAIMTLAVVLVLDVLLVVIFFKELKLISFDAALATSMGFSAALVHYGLMAAVAATSVACFEAVGSILVVAMMIAPGATAHLLTDRLGRMLWLSVLLGASAAIIGYQLASSLDTSVAGMMSTVAGVQFAVAALVSPRHGIIAKAFTKLALSIRIRREDLIASLYRLAESAANAPAGGSVNIGAGIAQHSPLRPSPTAPPSLPGTRPILDRIALRLNQRSGLVRVDDHGGLSLSEDGMLAGMRLIRSHRLWESFLTHHVGLEPDHVHDPSHRMEHFITDDMAARLGTEFAHQPDPHGKPVPGNQKPPL
ncbi:MAG: metal ABC transporter permease [Pyrinomonadaceae bacterium]|nr:metal ABC transporter permease [Phycisphaerales bacterium]